MTCQKSVCAVLCLFLSAAAIGQPPREKPLIRDFMGICVHTVQFKPELYKPVCRHVRDYHSLEWDVGDDMSRATTFPLAHNKVDWGRMYGQWVQAGYEINASIMLSRLPFETWKAPAADAFAYGQSFAAFFGPSTRNLVAAAEIGNEPGEFTDAQYRVVFENMARGFRQGDPKLKIVTCAAIAGASHKYAKSLDCVKGLEDLYDVINVHSYAQVQGWPTWQRSYPEDASIDYLKDVQAAIDWKNANAPGKDVWITEFGWDATTKENHKEGTFRDWKGSTDLEQAAYLVRSWFVFSAMDLQRAYMYWFNDNDEPSVHAASGLTRHYQPKPSYWAVSHLYRTLGGYRFTRKLVERTGDLYAYEYTHESDGTRIIAAWVPGAADRTEEITLPVSVGRILKIERMALTETAEKVDYRQQDGSIRIPAGGVPVYVYVGN